MFDNCVYGSIKQQTGKVVVSDLLLLFRHLLTCPHHCLEDSVDDDAPIIGTLKDDNYGVYDEGRKKDAIPMSDNPLRNSRKSPSRPQSVIKPSTCLLPTGSFSFNLTSSFHR